MAQIGYLEQWPVLEEECNDTLVEVTEALKASTIRLPVTSGAQVSGKISQYEIFYHVGKVPGTSRFFHLFLFSK